MKRSQLDTIIDDALTFCKSQNFHLPKWACWTPERWAQAGHEADEIRDHMLGWDVTDFGANDYERTGLCIFTIRNGQFGEKGLMIKDYCEKLLLIGEQQLTPTHFHWSKMEDIINRGGGRLVLEIWNADRQSEQLDETSPVAVSIDGIVRTVEPGGKVVLEPGESITLAPYMYHNFYAEAGAGRVLCGEVSRVNDDNVDNRFLDELPRFPAIEEDKPARYVLCTEYRPAAK